MRIVTCITGTAPVARILDDSGTPAEPPRIRPARGPPARDDPPVEAVPDWDALAQLQPEYVFEDPRAVSLAFGVSVRHRAGADLHAGAARSPRVLA